MIEEIKRFLTTFMSALSNCSLYSKEHLSVEELTQKAYSILERLFDDVGSIEIMIVEDDLVVNKTPIRDAGLHGLNFIKRLKRKGLSRVDFIKGLSCLELKNFIADIVDIEKQQRSYPHIRTGVVSVRLANHKIDASTHIDSKEIADFTEQQVEKVKDIYRKASPFKQLSISGLDEIVVNFILTFKREANILNLLSPVKAYSEYTYTHATNVAILTMLQAEALGIADELLHDIGIAALLHDAGKLFVSKDVLNKDGKLDEEEWVEMKNHTLYGARYISKIGAITPLAAIIAYEHHMKYDGSGYPERRIHNSKRQHICSQMVGIADFFDALRSKRPYKREWQIKDILSLMKKIPAQNLIPFWSITFQGCF